MPVLWAKKSQARKGLAFDAIKLSDQVPPLKEQVSVSQVQVTEAVLLPLVGLNVTVLADVALEISVAVGVAPGEPPVVEVQDLFPKEGAVMLAVIAAP